MHTYTFAYRNQSKSQNREELNYQINLENPKDINEMLSRLQGK